MLPQALHICVAVLCTVLIVSPELAQGTIPLYEGASVTPRPKVGTNLGVVLGEGTYCPWVNLMRCASALTMKRASNLGWIDTDQLGLTYRADGYPNGFDSSVVAVTSVHAKLNGHYTAGSYSLTFSGTGSVSVGGDATATTTASGSMTFAVAPANAGIVVTVNTSSSSDPVHNLVLVPTALQAAYATQPYDAAWLDLVKKFDTLRLAHWQRENYNGYASKQWNWGDRASRTHFTFTTEHGVPHEEIVALANQLNKSIWLSVPQFATSQYITSLAQFYKANLNTTNTTLYLQDSHNRLWLANPAERITRIKEIHAAFSAAFGGDSVAYQVVVACNICDEFLPYLDPTHSNYDAGFRGAVKAFAVDGAAYLGKHSESWQADGSVRDPYLETLRAYPTDVNRMARELLLADEVKWFTKMNAFALLNMSTYAYDGGVALSLEHYGHRFRNPNHTLAAFETELEGNLWNFETSNDANLKSLWAEWLERWYRSGGSLFIASQPLYQGAQCAFADTKIYGLDRQHCNYPALVRYVDEISTSNKLAGVLDFIDGGAIGANQLANIGAPSPAACSVTCVWGVCADGNCVCDAGYTGSACDTFDESLLPNRCNADDYGMNLGGSADWSPVWLWSNWMRFARRWISKPVAQPNPDRYGWIWDFEMEGNTYPWPPERSDSDSDGYPIKLAPNQAYATFLRRDTYEYPQGRYHVFYDGDGTLTFGMDTYVERRVRPGYIIVNVTSLKNLNNGLYVQIERTNPDDHLRNIRVVHDRELRTYHNDHFHPMLLHTLKDFKFIRFMSIQHVGHQPTNKDSPRTWSQRTRPSYFSQTAPIDGLSIEYIVALANRLHVRPWISIPYNADDDYISQQAAYVKAHLNPKLKPIIEYANEVWATHHHVGFYAADKGAQAFPQVASDAVASRACWNQKRSREAWVLYQAAGVEITRVLGGQSVWTRVLRAALECDSSAAQFVDALVIAPYFGVDMMGPRGVRALDDVFLAAQGNLNATVQMVADHVALAREFNIPSVGTYEAGPGFFGGANREDPDVVTRGREVHQDPRIADLVANYFDGMRAAGSTLSGYFMGPASQWSSYGAFGIRQFINEDPATSHKVNGYRRYAAANAATQCQAPAEASGCPNDCSGHGTCMRDNMCTCYVGWQGAQCDQEYFVNSIEECNKYTCEPKGGKCLPTRTQDHFKILTCVGCASGWSGWACHVPVCDSNCSWAGECTAPGTCTCYRGHTGTRCESDCGCKGHGTCNGDGTCACDVGYKLVNGACEPACDADSCLAPGIAACTVDCVFGGCWDGKCQCWSGFGGERCDQKAPSTSANRDSTMGINVAGVSDWTSSTEFLNLMFRSRSWFLNPADIDEPDPRWTVNEHLPLTPDGYPAVIPRNRVAGTFALRDTFNRDTNQQYFEPGEYVLLYDGEGRITVKFDAQPVENMRSKGRIVVQYTPRTILNNGFFIQIHATNPQNPIRNIRIYSPSHPHEVYAQVFVFHPAFLKDLAPYRSIRFSNWVGLGSLYPDGPLSHSRSWRDRKLPRDASMATRHGVSEDHMVSLCNWLNADPWFTIPHDATDDYVRKFARFIKLKLRPDVAIHIEHSNEVWNSQFESWKYASARGLRQFTNETTNPWEAANLWHGYRSDQIFSIFSEVFGPLQANRLRFKLGTFLMIPYWTRQTLSKVTTRPLSLAVTTYFCDETTFGGEVLAQTKPQQELVNECLEASTNSSTFAPLEAQAALAREFGLGLDSYEGGPALVQQNVLHGGYAREGVEQLYHSLHTNAAMDTIIPNFFSRHRTLGVDVEMYFTSAAKSSKYGSWGIKESTAAPCAQSPKCRATEKYIADNGNATKRAITWGLSEYGIRNDIFVSFTTAVTLEQLTAMATRVELSMSMPPGSVKAIFAPRTSGSSHRFKSMATATEAYFIATAQQSTTGSSLLSATSSVHDTISTVAASEGVVVQASSINTADTLINPNSPLPSDLAVALVGAEVNTVTIHAVSSEASGQGADNVLSNIGINVKTNTHSVAPDQMWLTSAGDVTPTIVFDLGSVVSSLRTVRVWNYNDVDGNAARGVQNAMLALSTDGTSFTDVTAFGLSQAPAIVADFSEDIDLGVDSSARYVRIRVSSNFGDTQYVGLSAVKFFLGTPIPPPATPAPPTPTPSTQAPTTAPTASTPVPPATPSTSAPVSPGTTPAPATSAPTTAPSSTLPPTPFPPALPGTPQSLPPPPPPTSTVPAPITGTPSPDPHIAPAAPTPTILKGPLIAPVSIANVSSQLGTSAVSLVDGVGLITGAGGRIHHTVRAEAMWTSANGDTRPWITFQLGASPRAVLSMTVWNYNDATAGNTDRGCKDIEILWSTDGAVFRRVLLATLHKAPGSVDIAFQQDIPFPEEVTAKYVQLRTIANFGSTSHTGLSAVQFHGPPVLHDVSARATIASASSGLSTPGRLLGGAGLQGTLHSTSSADMWLSDKAAWVVVDLGGTADVRQVQLWNYNEAGQTQQGFKDYYVSTSLDGVTFREAAFGVIAQAPGSATVDFSETVALDGTLCRYVKLAANSNYGGQRSGLSALQFFGTAITYPSVPNLPTTAPLPSQLSPEPQPSPLTPTPQQTVTPPPVSPPNLPTRPVRVVSFGAKGSVDTFNRSQLIADIAATLAVPVNAVKLLSVRAGSVVVEVYVDMADETASDAKVMELAAILRRTDSPLSQRYEVVNVRVATIQIDNEQSRATPAGAEGNNEWYWAVPTAAVGALCIIGMVAVFLRSRRGAGGPLSPTPSFADPSKVKVVCEEAEPEHYATDHIGGLRRYEGASEGDGACGKAAVDGHVASPRESWGASSEEPSDAYSGGAIPAWSP